MRHVRDKKAVALIVSLGVALALVVASCAQNAALPGSQVVQGEIVSAQLDDGSGRAPNFTWTTNDGQTAALADMLGTKPMVLEFFATWCPACMSRVPSLQLFYDQYAGEDLVFYAISLEENKSTVERWMNSAEIRYPVLLDPDGLAGRAYNSTTIPLVVGIGRGGKVVYRDHALPADLEAFVAALKQRPSPRPAATQDTDASGRAVAPTPDAAAR